ncbi:2-octaprenyl-3-methyl-6-methoxy-1,4-benzoquinol hydroxylase [Biformimicrobium ophioploci]|uniref:2-octaprenyl-3-methyl-6-methoxy-1,4-benzoquinol hydroxylase n=2 Tax=Biformimicrobium ophioploci TaxID=3036711 RepID=A0ABQ6M0M1_9GAMM|nr:2-octaprenyl-3-methyl-6-methoxy-1,4-benzoquinol hydroxylase [Microbulbifer sp. NKW57]
MGINSTDSVEGKVAKDQQHLPGETDKGAVQASGTEEPEMIKRRRADIAIIGAGMVGLAQAALLATRMPKLKIALLEAAAEIAPTTEGDYEARVVALTRASQSLLEEVGAWEAIAAQRLCPYTDMRVWDADGTGRIHFGCREIGEPNLGHIVENSVVVNALRDVVENLPNVELELGFRTEHWWRDCKLWNLQPRSEFPRLDDELPQMSEIVQAPLLIGADGARSQVRDQLQIETEDTDYQQQAIVTVVRTEKDHANTAWQSFLKTGPVAFLPLAGLGDLQHSAIVWSADDDLAQELLLLDDSAFALYLERATGGRLGTVECSRPRQSFPLRARHAQSYIGDGAVLVGDAAHNIHPLAGQGVNLGLRDVAVLAEEIQRGLKRNLPVGDPSTLKRYQRRRRADNMATLKAMSNFKSLFGEGALHWRWLRNTGLNMVDASPLLKKRIIMRAMAI